MNLYKRLFRNRHEAWTTLALIVTVVYWSLTSHFNVFHFLSTNYFINFILTFGPAGIVVLYCAHIGSKRAKEKEHE